MGKASSRKKPQRHIDPPAGKHADSETRAHAFPWWLIAALCLVAFLVYARALSYGFVHDDDAQILRNPWIRNWSHVLRFFFADVGAFTNEQPLNYYRPFHMLAHAVGYTLSGLQPFGFHLMNILLHCLNTLLVAFFGYRLTRDQTAAAAGGFLFAVHPVHAESVSWIAGIPDPLCAAFYLGTLCLYANQDPSRERKASLFGALLFLGALFSKEMAFVLPLLAVWLDLCFGRKLRWERYAAMAAAFGIYTALRMHALSAFQIKMLYIPMQLSDRLLNSVALMGEYLAKAFVPFNINPFHVFHPVVSIGDFRFLLGLLALMALGLGAWFLRNDKKLLFLIGFTPIALLPLLNITGISQNIFADRYLYIPSLGACLLLPLLVQKAARTERLRSLVSERKIVLGFAGTVGVLFAFMLHNTTFMWKDNLTLYSETMKRSPDSAPIANCLSVWYYKQGRMKEAEYWCHRAEENEKRAYLQFPELLCEIYVRLAFIYLDDKKGPEAAEYLKKAEQVIPNSPGVLQGLAKLYIMQGNYAEARKACETSLAINPQNDMMQNNLAIILLLNGEIDGAIEHARKAIEIFPQFSDAYMNLARGYAAKGMTGQAVEAYRHAQLLNPALQPEIERELGLIR
jgi:protein O-mannosyl-transferase